MQEFQVGQRVELIGGFHDGFEGLVVEAAELPAVLEPGGAELIAPAWRYTVRISDGSVEADCAGIRAVNTVALEGGQASRCAALPPSTKAAGPSSSGRSALGRLEG